MNNIELKTMVELLQMRAQEMPEKIAFTFLLDGETQELQVTYKEMDRRARAIAARLQASGEVGRRALLLFPQGLEFIQNFFGCLYAGVIAVPAYPPRLHKKTAEHSLQRIQAMAANARPDIALTLSSIYDKIESIIPRLPDLKEIEWIAADRIDMQADGNWREPEIHGDSLAFLQYTSGSTGTPKGVMVSHHNLIHNAEMSRRALRHTEELIMVSWLPLFHDMGLIGGVIQAMMSGGRSILMSPASFLQKPIRWLEAISRYRGTTSGAPDFAYELCAQKIAREDVAGLDLSCWEVAFNGAEPINGRTLERFAEVFGNIGFRKESFTPMYGLAEATLMVSGVATGKGAFTGEFSARELEKGNVLVGESGAGSRTLVSSGSGLTEQVIRIVDPETRLFCPPDKVGEIWLSGAHVTQGYWERPDETRETFEAYTEDTGEGPFLRTGDLGFIKSDNVFVAGRLKDLIIINGVNHYPQDIERTTCAVHKTLSSIAAAFSVDVGGHEKVVVVVEVERTGRKADFTEVFKLVRQKVFEEHELSLYGISVVSPASIRKTTSGKIQRKACKQDFLEGKLKLTAQWRADMGESLLKEKTSPVKKVIQRSQEGEAGRMEALLLETIRANLEPAPEFIDPEAPLSGLGLSSALAVIIAGELQQVLKRELSPVLLYEHETIRELANFLAQGDVSAAVPLSKKITSEEPIAVIGAGCRFPGGANDLDSFWELLVNGVDGVREIPAERWELEDYFHSEPGKPGRSYSKWGAFIEDVDQFDADFFGISHREADNMDPQQRLLLEVCWETLENAGLSVAGLRGSKTGVFAGISNLDYHRLQFRTQDNSMLNPYSFTGVSPAVAVGRISHVLGFRGPNLAVDTACSSALASVHTAVQSLRSGLSEMALAGGVNLILSPEVDIYLSQLTALAPGGRCKTFDQDAEGYVRGEGCGMVLLKRLSDAQRDGNRILGVIRGSALNHDGASAGLTVPSGTAQRALIRSALNDARVDAGQVAYVEAHGTATALGDPIEVNSLSSVLSSGRESEKQLYLGSVKTNIGHLEAAAGIAGFIKALLAVQAGEIPGNLHFKKLNSGIQTGKLNLRIPVKLSPWPANQERRIAGVSSFGISGTNVHVLLEQAPEPAQGPAQVPGPERKEHLLIISAKTRESLQGIAKEFAYALKRLKSEELADFCYTAAMRDNGFEHRLALWISSLEEGRAQLQNFLEARPGAYSYAKSTAREVRETVFIFSGQGAQWRDAGRELMEKEPVFRATMTEIQELQHRFMGGDLVRATVSQDYDWSDMENSQPAIFGFQVAFARLLISRGVNPAAVVGHSVGEVAAAHISGALSLEEAVRVICLRGRVMQEFKENARGCMAMVGLSPLEARKLLKDYKGRLFIAAHNAPETIVITGDEETLEELLATLPENVFQKMLAVRYSGHNPRMDAASRELETILAGLECMAPEIPIYSTVTGEEAQGINFDAAYWRKNVREQVEFAGAMESLILEGHRQFLEISPRSLLAIAVEQNLEGLGQVGNIVAAPGREEGEMLAVLRMLGELYVNGVELDRRKIYARGRILSLPTYIWERRRFWLASPKRRPEIKKGDHPLLGRLFQSPLNDYIFSQCISPEFPEYLKELTINQMIIMPAACFAEMALSAGRKVFDGEELVLGELSLSEAMVLHGEEERNLQLIMTPTGREQSSFRIFSRGDTEEDEWILHAEGKIEAVHTEVHPPASFKALSALFPRKLEALDIYRNFLRRGVSWGPLFRGIEEVYGTERGGETMARVRLHDNLLEDLENYTIHPCLLEACFQSVMAGVEFGGAANSEAWIPLGLNTFRLYKKIGAEVWVRAKSQRESNEHYLVFLELLDESGVLLAELHGLRIQRVSRQAISRLKKSGLESWLYEPLWRKISPVENILPEKNGVWIFWGRGGLIGRALFERLETEGFTVLDAQANIKETIETLSESSQGPLRGLVYLKAMDSGPEVLNGDLWGEVLRVNAGLAQLVQEVRESGIQGRLFLATLGSQKTNGQIIEINPVQSPLWGAARTLAYEHPELNYKIVDLDPNADETENAGNFYAELLGLDGEHQVAYQGGRRYGLRLTGVPEREVKGPERLEIRPGDRGDIDKLRFVHTSRRSAGPGEVEIQNKASGLNYKDVLTVLDMIPGESHELGIECSGIVVGVGAGVEEFIPGDKVMAIAPGGFSTFVTVDARLVCKKPSQLSFEQAATIPVTFLTAYYGLHQIGKIKKGDRVLIHAASGGVGPAALQLAKLSGAEPVFATASLGKHEFVKSQGASYVMDSRSLEFAEQIRELSGGHGLDIILNSLSGAVIDKSLDLLAPGGVFLEIGKTDIRSPEELERTHKGVNYVQYELPELCRQEPELIRKMLVHLKAEFERGRLKALPMRTFERDEILEAFHYMAHTSHRGKIIIRGEGRSRPEKLLLDSKSVYLITGGLGGLGLAVAAHLGKKGTGHIVLSGRGEPTVEARMLIRDMKKNKTLVYVRQCDVSRAEEVRALVQGIEEEIGPLRGVIHAAGVQEDEILLNQTVESFERVMSPKINGAWNLHQATEKIPLDFFVLFSSAASLLGAYAQSNYAAANAFLDGLALYRRMGGLAALSINWGNWSEIGRSAKIEKEGVVPVGDTFLDQIAPEQGLKLLDFLLGESRALVGVLPVHWPRYLKNVNDSNMSFYFELKPETEEKPLFPGPGKLRERLRGKGNREILERYLLEVLAEILARDSRTLGPDQPINSLGADSLMVMEMRKRLESDLGVTISFSDILGGIGTAELAGKILARIGKLKGRPADSQGGPAQVKSGDDTSSLVEIQSAGKGRPIFWVHPVGGNVLCYVGMARQLGDTRPFYGLQSRGFQRGAVPHTRVEEMAAAYIRELKNVQPQGPYSLGGWSMGGLVAFAMAQSLRRAGDEVSELIMLDTYRPEKLRISQEMGEAELLISLMRDLAGLAGYEDGVSLEEMRRLPPGRQREYFMAESRRMGLLPGAMELAEVEQLLDIFKANLLAFGLYRPEPYLGPVTFIEAEVSGSDRGKADHPWRDKFPESFALKKIPGNHFSIMREPHIQELARVLKGVYRRA